MSHFQTNKYCVVGKDVFIDISTARHPATETIIDIGDLPIALDGKGRWAACANNDGRIYARRRSGQRMHRHLLGLGPGRMLLIDHRDRDSLNNRRANLRMADKEQNRANGRGRSRAKPFKGVYLHKQTGKYRAMIQIKGKLHSLGLFSSEIDAALAYDRAATGAWGAFAFTNLSPQGAATP